MEQVTDTGAWLREVLAGGPMSSREIGAMASEAGITAKALRGARERLDLIVRRSGNGRAMRSTWELPLSIDRGLEAAGIEALNDSAMYARPRAREAAHERGDGCTSLNVRIEAAPMTAQPALGRAPALESFEQARVDRRESIFAGRGMTAPAARELAVRLVLERDRCAPPAGSRVSCIECQERDRCDQRHEWSEIHYCHFARRDLY